MQNVRREVFPAFYLLLFILLIPCLAVAQSEGRQDAVSESDFLADADVAVAKLKTVDVDSLDIPKNRLPSFVRRMERSNKKELRKAEIKFAGRKFVVLLGENPAHEFGLCDIERDHEPYWWGSWSLHSYHMIDGAYYVFRLLDDDKKIGVRPYRGELGVFKVGAGDRALETVEVSGSIMQEGSASAPVGRIEDRWPEAVSECKVPVGDYTAYIMSVTYDNLRISLSHNYHTNAQGQSATDHTVYGMKVTKDVPYVLDLSNDPMAVFHQPSKDQDTISRGKEIKFAAVLIDPKLDVMVRGLDDTAVEVEKKYSSGQTYKRPKSLDPKVVISRADGEIVGEGVMPFG